MVFLWGTTMNESRIEWPDITGTLSIIEAVENGSCVDISYVNTLAPYNTDTVVGNLLGHDVLVELGGGDNPDVFSVTPLAGWELITENFIAVEEYTTAIITVCQMLLG